ncbi:MAG TPA: hypothetical protein VFC53_11425 [Dehalococcoidia bacterium]|nr:hypothetical protein [Dehalococcoidia bacterium]
MVARVAAITCWTLIMLVFWGVAVMALNNYLAASPGLQFLVWLVAIGAAVSSLIAGAVRIWRGERISDIIDRSGTE